jgi:hypothetical protein
MYTKRFAAALGAAFFCTQVWAAPLIAQGSASLDAGVTAAREMAIQDAMHQAALSQGAQIESAQYMNSGMVSESSSLTAAPLAGKVKVLDEGTQDGLYQVRIQVDASAPSASRSRRASQASSCASPNGRTLRRRVITAYFTVDRPAEANDLDALGIKLAHELAQRLTRRGDSIQARDAANLTVMPSGYLTDPNLGAPGVRQLAQSSDSQFVVTGRVLSTAVTDRSVRLSLFESNKTSQQGAYYTGPFSALTGGALRYRAVERQFDMELWIYDGLTGTLLTNQRLSTLAHGDVQPGDALPFASIEFWKSDYGSPIDGLLDQAVNQVLTTLSCIPFSARVLRVDQGRQVYLDAGGMDGLQVGDKLLIYRPRVADSLQVPVSGRLLGVPETLLGDVSVIQVQPNLSIAVVQSVRGKVQEGDVLRFIPKR